MRLTECAQWVDGRDAISVLSPAAVRREPAVSMLARARDPQPLVAVRTRVHIGRL